MGIFLFIETGRQNRYDGLMLFVSKSVRETADFATKIAGKISKNFSKKPIVIALEGELGAGKTTFVRAFAKALGVKKNITSPTFVLIKPYKTADKVIYHIDAYRLKDYKDLEKLGAKGMMTEPGSITLIEWSDRVKKIIPRNGIRIHIDHIDKNTRKITCVNL